MNIRLPSRAKLIRLRERVLSALSSAAIVVCAVFSVNPPLHADKIRDLVQVGGVRSNQLIGYGLVVGLDGSGDQTTQAPFTT